jgi:O-antigen/teichoic acid export membrane protein
MLAVGAGTVRLTFGRIPLPRHGEALRRVALACWPLAMLDALQIVQFKVDTLMIFSMVSADAVAQYETAYRLLEVSRLAVRPLAVIAFPTCVALATRGRWHEVGQLMGRTVALAGALGTALALVVGVAPETIMGAVWGAEYRDSGPLLRVLFLTAPLLLIGVVSSSLVNAIHLERTLMVLMGAAALLNLGLNAWAIPIWGAEGAAWTTLTTQGFMTVTLLLIWRSALRKRSNTAGA